MTEATRRPRREQRVPRWVWVLVIVAIVAAAAFGILHFAGIGLFGPGGHAP